MKPANIVHEDPWDKLRAHTAARIALGRAGGSLPTKELLAFRLAHARARDAVHSHFDPAELAAELRSIHPEVCVLSSAARDRAHYLHRPDQGRRLSEESRSEILACSGRREPCDLVIIVSDGLSSHAAVRHASPLLAELIPHLLEANWRLAPLVVARHARVGIQDEIGAEFAARISLILIGERPGLAASDSLGAYFTYEPAPGRTDADRNCLSNIHLGGLPPARAAAKLFHLLQQSRHLGVSGVSLKDESRTGSSSLIRTGARFLLPPREEEPAG